jgi:gas vesicle structural protein
MAAVAATPRGYLERPRPSGLADVVDVILDKGIVIDAYVRVALIGIEILTIDARIVIASVDTYLRFAEAVNRMDISSNDQAEGLPQLIEHMTKGGAESKTKGALEGAKEKLFGGGDDDKDEDSSGNGRQRKRSTSRAASSSGSSRSRSTRSKSRSSSGNGKK